ncbi:MAG: hypothetical protein K2F97_02450 [Muribaculaceae bacterium]|nr:hypothetical protein [Muribaculaceae bacterium]
MEENIPSPPPYTGADTDDETPMYGSAATGSTDTPASPAIDSTFLSHMRPGFWD